MSIENLDAAKELVKKYRSITIDDFNDVEDDVVLTLTKITGFGYIDKCSLCKAVDKECRYCLYSYNMDVNYYYCVNHSTYHDIRNSYSKEEIVKSIHARADYIELLINKIENDHSGG